MAGPKAPIGSLSAHSTKSANLARSVSASKFGAASNVATKRTIVKEESESDSNDSDSDSSDSSDVDHDKILRDISAKSSGTKSKVEAKTATPTAKQPTSKNQASSANIKSKAIVKKQESSSEESSSSESESESESEDEPSSESDEEKAAEPSKGAKLNKKPEASWDKSTSKDVKKAEESDSDTSSSSSSSSSSSESEEAETKPEKKAATKSNATKAESKAESSSSSEASESESESSDSEPEEADESMAIDRRNGNDALSRIPEVISNEFHLRKAEEGTNAADVAKFFNEAQKEGKQIWYFTAPASIPIEVVEKLEIPLERAQKGQSILSHKGDNYGVAFEDAATSRAIKLLIPSKAGDQYHMLNAPVAQTMHLKRVTQFSQNGESSLTQTAHTSTARPPRPQPEGLKARFQPIGVTNGSLGKVGGDLSDEDVDMTEAPALPSSQKTPAKKSKVKDSGGPADKKRKLDSVVGVIPTSGADTPESIKKSKKARVDPKPTPKGKSEAPNTTAGKVTPIVPPVVPGMRRESSSQALPASTPSSSKTKPKALSASQPTPTSKTAELTSSAIKKESKVPLPPTFPRASSSVSSQPKEEAKTNGKVKKEKKSKAIKTEPEAEAPKKTTPVPLPNIPSS